MSSEDYLDKLLQEMMEGKVADGGSQPVSDADRIFKDIPSDTSSDISLDIPSEISTDIPGDISSEIPQNVDSMGVVIDRAPSLAPKISDDNVSQNDISELMADIMPAMNEENSNTDALTEDTSSVFNFDPNKTLGDYINESDSTEDLSDNESLASSDQVSSLLDFPSMPKAPDIPEVSNQEYVTAEQDAAEAEDFINSNQDYSDISEIKNELANDFGDDLNSNFDDEADIEKMIEKARNAQREQHEAVNQSSDSEPSLDELLSSDSNLAVNDIGNLLEKAENNEAVDEGISALLNGDSFGNATNQDDLSSLGLQTDDNIASDPKANKEALKAEKKKLKEEKKRQKEAEKEAKRRAKAEKKASGQNENAVVEEDSRSGNIDFDDIDALLEEAGRNADSNADNNADANDTSDIFGGGFDSFSDFNSTEPQTDNVTDALSAVGGGEDYSEPGTISDANLFEEGMSDQPSNVNFSSENANGGNAEGYGVEASADGAVEKSKKNPFKALIDKIKNFLTESDEEEDEEKSEIILSDENAAILDELSQEGDGEGKKKGKKKKDKKGKKEKGDSEDITNPDDLPEKPEKPKKAKKEKKKKDDTDSGKPSKKLPVKKVAAVVFMAIALTAALIFLVNITGNYSVKKTARAAYNSGDYQTCYQEFFGKELSDSDAMMYNQSECILKIRLWYREYEMFEDEESEIEALDSLIQSVNSYPGLYASAKDYNCLDKVEPEYEKIIDVLADKYGLSEEDAIAIASLQDDVTYSRVVNAIVNGVSYQDALDAVNGTGTEENDNSENVSDEASDSGNTGNIGAQLIDKLPEEEGMSSNSFIEP